MEMVSTVTRVEKEPIWFGVGETSKTAYPINYRTDAEKKQR